MNGSEYEKYIKTRNSDFEPWLVKLEDFLDNQELIQSTISKLYNAKFGKNCYIAPSAIIVAKSLLFGDRSFVAAGAVVRGDVEVGSDCSINTGVHIAGRVRIGSAVRIAPGVGLYGFDHANARVDLPIKDQGITSLGIEIGDDTWIGANAVIVDNVRIGAHCIIGAGAVVTKDVRDYQLVGGNPASVIHDRRNRALGPLLQAFETAVRTQLPTVVAGHARQSPSGLLVFLDQNEVEHRVRPLCDAVEICAMFDQSIPGMALVDARDQLAASQDRRTGIVPRVLASSPDWTPPGDNSPLYDTMITYYALRLLGEKLPHQVHGFCDLDPDALVGKLASLDWRERAWHAGDWIDCYASCIAANRWDPRTTVLMETLFDWLDRNCDPASGMWGQWSTDGRWLQPVNGFYRLTRGTYAQFGRPLPHPERSIDTILQHAADETYFAGASGNACNILDVVHPLWLCHRQTDHRREETEHWVRARLPMAIGAWVENRGFAFDPGMGPTSLQGTEMWLSIVYLMADILKLTKTLTFRPKGVHRLLPLRTVDPGLLYRPAGPTTPVSLTDASEADFHVRITASETPTPEPAADLVPRSPRALPTGPLQRTGPATAAHWANRLISAIGNLPSWLGRARL